MKRLLAILKEQVDSKGEIHLSERHVNALFRWIQVNIDLEDRNERIQKELVELRKEMVGGES